MASHPRNVTSVSFSPDGGTLASSGLGNVVKIWDVGSREAVAEIAAPGEAATSCMFLPSGELCCFTYEGAIAVYSAGGYEPVAESGGPLPGARPFSAAVIPGAGALMRSVEGGVQVVSLDSMSVLAEVKTGIKGMYGVASSPDGGTVAAVGADGKCRVWELVG